MTGKEFKEWRISKGISQNEIAKRAKVTRQTICHFEQKRDLKAVRIIEAYGLGIRPIAYSISENIDEIESRLKEAIEQKVGRKCKVKINIELCGDEA